MRRMTRVKIMLLVASALALGHTAASTAAAAAIRTATLTITSAWAANGAETDVSFTYVCTGGPALIADITVSVTDLTSKTSGTSFYAEPGATCDGTPHSLVVSTVSSDGDGDTDNPCFQAGDQAQVGVALSDATRHSRGPVLTASAVQALTLGG